MRWPLLATSALCMACTNQPTTHDDPATTSAGDDRGLGAPFDEPNCATNRFLPECFAERIGDRREDSIGNGTEYTNGDVPN